MNRRIIAFLRGFSKGKASRYKFLLVFLLLWTPPLRVYPQEVGWQWVERILGQQGSVQGGILKITFPRSDLKVQVGQIPIEPGLALTSWIAFKGMGGQAMAMGDLVLLEEEVPLVVPELVRRGLQVTALHNHLVGETPKVMYLHFWGRGNLRELAQDLRAVLSLTRTPFRLSSVSPEGVGIESGLIKTIEALLGHKGQGRGNLLQFSIPRKERVREEGEEIPPFMGVASAINFQQVAEKMAVAGDLVLLAEEVNPVIQALSRHKIAVTAIHNHMLSESPRLFFLHFWGYDDPRKLAQGLKEALDRMKVQ